LWSFSWFPPVPQNKFQEKSWPFPRIFFVIWPFTNHYTILSYII
jgi:hypothetical protein